MFSAVTIKLICFRVALAIGLSTVVTRSRVGTSVRLEHRPISVGAAKLDLAHLELILGGDALIFPPIQLEAQLPPVLAQTIDERVDRLVLRAPEGVEAVVAAVVPGH